MDSWFNTILVPLGAGRRHHFLRAVQITDHQRNNKVMVFRKRNDKVMEHLKHDFFFLIAFLPCSLCVLEVVFRSTFSNFSNVLDWFGG